MSAVQIIKTYFDVKEEGYNDKEGLPSLLEELRDLSTEEKLEIARAAAVELGVNLKED